jgi:hypothetical protein
MVTGDFIEVRIGVRTLADRLRLLLCAALCPTHVGRDAPKQLAR